MCVSQHFQHTKGAAGGIDALQYNNTKVPCILKQLKRAMSPPLFLMSFVTERKGKNKYKEENGVP